jgi:hypothetical protein
MRIGRGNRSTVRKPAPVPLCPPQIPHDLTWVRTRALRGGKPATNRLSYGTATEYVTHSFNFNKGQKHILRNSALLPVGYIV